MNIDLLPDLDDPEFPAMDLDYARSQERSARASAQARCGCGRFGKQLAYRSYYNGLYTAESVDVLCKAHGKVTVQLV